MRAQLNASRHLSDHRSTILLRGLRRSLKITSIMPRVWIYLSSLNSGYFRAWLTAKTTLTWTFYSKKKYPKTHVLQQKTTLKRTFKLFHAMLVMCWIFRSIWPGWIGKPLGKLSIYEFEWLVWTRHFCYRRKPDAMTFETARKRTLLQILLNHTKFRF